MKIKMKNKTISLLVLNWVFKNLSMKGSEFERVRLKILAKKVIQTNLKHESING